MSDLIGQIIRSYEIKEVLGKGGNGVVYLAFSLSLKRHVAIKVINPEHATDPAFRQRFENEALVLAKLEHAHIVPIYDYWYEDDRAYLVMRLMRGGSLSNRVKNETLSPGDVNRLLNQVADALTAAHQEGIIHRDVKPDNILFDKQNNAHLSDFGLAKYITPISESSISVVGTLWYMAPEQAAGMKVTAAADVYSLGVTIYECLAGIHPFPDQPLRHLSEDIPSIGSQRPDLPLVFDKVIHRATHKNPQYRYSSASEFAFAFSDAMNALAIPSENDVIAGVVADDFTPITNSQIQRAIEQYRKPSSRFLLLALIIGIVCLMLVLILQSCISPKPDTLIDPGITPSTVIPSATLLPLTPSIVMTIASSTPELQTIAPTPTELVAPTINVQITQDIQATQTTEMVTSQFEAIATAENIYRACFADEQEWRVGETAAIDNLGILRLLRNPTGYSVDNLSPYDAEDDARVIIRVDSDGGTRGASCWHSGYRIYYFVEKEAQAGAVGWVRSDLLKRP